MLFFDDLSPGASGWMNRAECAGAPNADAWFPSPGASMKAATEVCERCPVVEECLAYAIENGIDEGLWGGLSARERRRTARVRR